MQLNVTTDYAIRIVLYLAIKKEITTSKRNRSRDGDSEKIMY